MAVTSHFLGQRCSSRAPGGILLSRRDGGCCPSSSGERRLEVGARKITLRGRGVNQEHYGGIVTAMGVRTSGWEKRGRTDADCADARVMQRGARRGDARKIPTRKSDVWGTLGKTNSAEIPNLRKQQPRGEIISCGKIGADETG